MNPRQASLLRQAAELSDQLAPRQAAKVPTQFWEYTDEDGKSFYLPEKLTTVRSPYTGKSMTGQKPTPVKPGQFGAELKEQKEKAKTASKIDHLRWKA